MVLFLAPRFLSGQEVSTGELYRQARESAFSGHRQEAKETLRQLLERSPTHADGRVLLGRIHTWDREFDQAREHLLTVLETRPTYTDARRALVDVENRTGQYEEAIRQADIGLGHAPGDAALLVRKSAALRSLGRWQEAEQVAMEAVELNPDDSEAQTALIRIRNRPMERRVRVGYTFERLNTFEDDWHTTSISVSDRLPFGGVTLSTDLAQRFGRGGAQFELDAYPGFAPGVYGYLNFGTSSAHSFFPKFRFGGELHVGLPAGLEASAGLRHLRFSESDVTVYTGSLTKYKGRYLFSGRTYVTPKDEGGASVSGQFGARYYMGDRYNFVGLTIGLGSRPDIDEITDVQLQRLNSQSIRLQTELPLNRRWNISFNGGYRREELPTDSFRYQATFGTGLQVKF